MTPQPKPAIQNQPLAHALYELLRRNSNLNFAALRPQTNPPLIDLLSNSPALRNAIDTPERLKHYAFHVVAGPPFTPHICPPTFRARSGANTVCQDEPIQLGTQIQPQGASWVGTAGAPIAWPDAPNAHAYGILSNWHVFCGSTCGPGKTQHQPDDSKPACATLTDSAKPQQDAPNYIDAAIANALIDGKHTIANTILHIGKPAATPADAAPGLPVCKSGRTTAYTRATCSATGAAVRVSYGDFEAIFVDQDVFEDDEEIFSAPGDSGSLILACAAKAPTSLLFAGGGDLTIGNPIRYVNQAFQLTWGF